MSAFVVMPFKLKGKVKTFLIDYADYADVSQYSWAIDTRGYVSRKLPRNGQKKRKQIRLHTHLMNTPKGMVIDHINRNPSDNRRQNLRICSYSLNSVNKRLQSNNTSGYRGVSWDNKLNKWQANITVNGFQMNLGRFLTKEEAAEAYRKAALAEFGEFLPKEGK